MERLGGKVWSYLPDGKDGCVRCSVGDVMASNGFEVGSYPELVERVATIGYLNSRHNLFFRGQGKDHRIPSKSKHPSITQIYPSLFRTPRRVLSADERRRRLEKLDWYSAALARSYPGRFPSDRQRLNRFDELRWALLQHYQVCDTPLIDVTQSLRVASSFATLDNDGTHGFVYVLGLPNVNGSISFHADDGMVLVRLQSVCPPEAKRAHYQEGHLVGQFPPTRRKHSSLNLAARMLAKFTIRLDTFWSDAFPPIRREALMPEDDDLLDYFDDLEEGRVGV